MAKAESTWLAESRVSVDHPGRTRARPPGAPSGGGPARVGSGRVHSVGGWGGGPRLGGGVGGGRGLGSTPSRRAIVPTARRWGDPGGSTRRAVRLARWAARKEYERSIRSSC